jgi:hypothetical protein
MTPAHKEHKSPALHGIVAPEISVDRYCLSYESAILGTRYHVPGSQHHVSTSQRAQGTCRMCLVRDNNSEARTIPPPQISVRGNEPAGIVRPIEQEIMRSIHDDE